MLPTALARLRRLRFRQAAVVMAALAVTEAIEPVKHFWLAFGVRLVGALTLWLAGELAFAGGRGSRRMESFAAVSTVVWVVAILDLHGGEQSVLMPFVPAVGLGIAALLKGRPRAVLLAHALLVGGVAFVFWNHESPAFTYARWLPPTVVLGAVVAYAARESDRTRTLLIEAVDAGLQAADHERELRRELEAQRAVTEKAEHLALLGQVAAGVAHEVNNPLAVLKANLEYATAVAAPQPDSGASPAELAELFTDSGVALERIRLVVVQLKAFADEGPRAAQRASSTRLLGQALTLAGLRVKPPVRLAATLDDHLPEVLVDIERFTHVVVGALLNAAQALEGERPMRAGPRVELAAWVAGKTLVVEVTDNGPGFSPQALERVFTPFFTTKTEGAGMGLTLSVARRYLRSLGGEVEAANRPEGGACVRLVVPLAG